MARVARAEVFDPDEVAAVHVVQRCVRRCFLLGNDPVSGRNYDHRRRWLEERLRHFAACFGIDLLGFSILSNHFHLILRSRPDIVAEWDDTEVARQWLKICPLRRDADGKPAEPSQAELDTIRRDRKRLKLIRRRLSDISWWMRLLSQPLAVLANKEDQQQGRFWQGRFRAMRLCDESAILACAAYVDLNPIRAGLSLTLETSDFTSIQRRIASLVQAEVSGADFGADRFLAPVALHEPNAPAGPHVSITRYRCSDKGFLPLTARQYVELLDWTARQVIPGKRGSTPADAPAVLKRLGLEVRQWSALVLDFGRLFSLVAGLPRTLGDRRAGATGHAFRTRRLFRDVFPLREASPRASARIRSRPR